LSNAEGVKSYSRTISDFDLPFSNSRTICNLNSGVNVLLVLAIKKSPTFFDLTITSLIGVVQSSVDDSLQLQSNDKIKALELELNEIKEDTSQADTNKVDSFYKDLREDKQESNSTTNKKGGLLSRFFK